MVHLRIPSLFNATPSSGGIHVLQILNTIENDHLHRKGQLNPESIHLMSSSMQQAFADRAEHLGDADFVSVPMNELISKEYAQKVRKMIPTHRARKVDEVKPGKFDLKKSQVLPPTSR